MSKVPMKAALKAFDVTAAVRRQIEAVDELAKLPQGEDQAPALGRMTQATMELLDAWESYQRELDPKAWDAAAQELERLRSLGLLRESEPASAGKGEGA